MVLALGSNQGDREGHLRRAVRDLTGHVRIDGVSSVYASAPVGFTDQPEFLNAVVVGRTGLGPEDLLDLAHRLEARAGRIRTFRNAPRTLDVDLVLHGSTIRDRVPPLLPHPRWTERAFVLAPLAEVAPGTVDPRTGRTVEAIWRDARHSLPEVRLHAPPDRLWRSER